MLPPLLLGCCLGKTRVRPHLGDLPAFANFRGAWERAVGIGFRLSVWFPGRLQTLNFPIGRPSWRGGGVSIVGTQGFYKWKHLRTAKGKNLPVAVAGVKLAMCV